MTFAADWVLSTQQLFHSCLCVCVCVCEEGCFHTHQQHKTGMDDEHILRPASLLRGDTAYAFSRYREFKIQNSKPLKTEGEREHVLEEFAD